MAHENSPTPWRLVRSEQGPGLVIFQSRFDLMENPRNGRVTRAVVLQATDWVNIVAVRPDRRVLVVRQYRFGTGEVTTEIPAGMVEPDETHEQAARRELKEETGYESARWEYLGWVEPNPAFLNNRCHQWLAVDVHQTEPARPEEGEDISATALSLEELRQEVQEGRLRHSLALLALSQVFDLRTRE